MSLLRVPIVTLLLAWLVPGLGHVVQGKAWRGVVFFVLITHSFAVGLHLTDGLCVSRQEHPVAFLAQAPAGLTVLLSRVYEARRAAENPAIFPLRPRQGAPDEVAKDPAKAQALAARQDELVARLDMGLLYTMVAGLLNFLLAVDAFERAIRRGQEEAHEGARAASALGAQEVTS